MKIGFVFDTILYKKNDDYFGMTLTYDFFKARYLDKIDKMSIITRTQDISLSSGNIDGYRITNGKNVDVNPIHYYNRIPDAFLKRKKIKNELTNQLIKCDKVIIRMPSMLGILACDICEKAAIPYMIEMVACAWDGYNNHTNKVGKLIAPFMYFSTKKCVSKCNYVLYVTSKFLQKRYPSSGKQFSCSDVSLCDLNESVLSSKINAIDNFDEKKFSLCTLANVGMKYKGHIYVLKVMKKLKKDGYNIKYYLAGNGDQSYLKKIIKKYNLSDNVEFLGSLPHDKVFNLLDRIDIYIQPSLQEGLPRALVEAMSRGCCCIGSNVGGIPELLDKEFIFKRKKTKELYKILKNLTKEDVIKQGQINFEKSKMFGKQFLDNKRNSIYINFMEE